MPAFSASGCGWARPWVADWSGSGRIPALSTVLLYLTIVRMGFKHRCRAPVFHVRGCISEAVLYWHSYLWLSSRPGTRPGSSSEFEVRGRIQGGFLASEPASHSLGMIRRGMRWANAVKIHPGASANRDNSNQWTARDAESRFVHESLPRQPISPASRSTVTCACST